MRIVKWLILIVLPLMLCSGCYGSEVKPKENDLLFVKSKTGRQSKKVILLLVDTLMYQTIDKGIKQNKLPTLQYLIDHGQYYKDLVSSFPTMSVTIDSSLLTGTYPDKHRVPGLIWYSANENKIIAYGTGPVEILKQGVDSVLTNALIDLNGKHLDQHTETIYEQLKKEGLKTGSINGIIYRGPVDHKLSIPRWIKGTTGLPAEINVKGPDFLSFGALSNPLEGLKSLPDALTNRMGFNNEYTVETVKYLIQNNKLPDFLFAYLPDLDQEIHKKGPSELDAVIKVDQQLQSLLHAFGSPEEALNKATIVIVGDSGMSQILPAGKKPVIDLTKILNNYRLLQPGAAATRETDIVLAVNETMAYVYKLNTNESISDIANVLKAEARIDFISWKEDGWIHVVQAGTSQQLKYKPNGPISDSYGQSWTIEQHPEVLDLRINQNKKTLEYGEYPDGLRRLYGAFHSHEGDFLIVTAKKGYELVGHSSPTHRGGGGHGALHQTESLIPLIISGTDEKPGYRRIVDIKSYLLQLLTNDLKNSESKD
ncbi:alkaline phosphatase family protein [Paenibacillus alkaliterrae]|uniref:alkaline phosphatase family protein n=1 Tax=Paenibacillus alkaliterrae TaxID=320909 RepID=UPI001F448114|nr:alkaline phosphatase family protein [Paenibacillus alkaliterrae]MCF2939960.1 alkaline phosphatase family protein [Paenibacillus alkaliterrae]